MSPSQIRETMAFVEEHDVKFIRLAFCDALGRQKNLAVTVERLERVLQEGQRFDGTGAMPLDLYLHPIASTMQILPWRPQQGRVLRFFCSLRHADGSEFEEDTRLPLLRAERDLRDMGLECEIGTKESFYLFHLDAEGRPTERPLDQGGFMDIAPLDRGENVRRETCLMLEQMNISTENSMHGHGPGQNAVALRHSTPTIAADDMVTFQSVTSMIASTHGLHASFAPTPLENQPQNWLHVNLSLHRDGQNLCTENAPEWQTFIAGIETRLPEIQAIAYASAPAKDALQTPQYRTPDVHCKNETHVQIRFPGGQINPHLLFAMLLRAGLDGSKKQGGSRGSFVRSAIGDALMTHLQRNKA